MTEARLYLDANVFIYAVEGDADIASLLRQLFDLFGLRRATGVTSELTLAEVLARAVEANRRVYLDLIVRSGIFDLQPVSRDVLIETARYRGHAGMTKLPDAIHMVTAIQNSCRTVLSADARWRLPDGFSLLKPVHENLARLVEELS